MKAKVLGFGEIELDGEHYDHDIVIQAGEVKKRKRASPRDFAMNTDIPHCPPRRTSPGEESN
jgi:hypothetical protein